MTGEARQPFPHHWSFLPLWVSRKKTEPHGFRHGQARSALSWSGLVTFLPGPRRLPSRITTGRNGLRPSHRSCCDRPRPSGPLSADANDVSTAGTSHSTGASVNLRRWLTRGVERLPAGLALHLTPMPRGTTGNGMAEFLSLRSRAGRGTQHLLTAAVHRQPQPSA